MDFLYSLSWNELFDRIIEGIALCAFPITIYFFVRTLIILLHGEKFVGRIVSYYVSDDWLNYTPFYDCHEVIQVDNNQKNNVFLMKCYRSLKPRNAKRTVWIYKKEIRCLTHLWHQWVAMLLCSIIFTLMLSTFGFNALYIVEPVFIALFISAFYYLFAEIQEFKRLGLGKYFKRLQKCMRIRHQRDKLLKISFPFYQKFLSMRGQYISAEELRAIEYEKSVLFMILIAPFLLLMFF